MESLHNAANKALEKIKSGGEVTLYQPRKMPLTDEEIRKIDRAIELISEIEVVYGDKPVRDYAGNIFKWEFGPIGEDRKINKEFSESLRKAVLTPATKEAIIHHVTKLAAMVRDTRGEEALAVIAYEISRECKKVSEWAVIEACRDYWKSGAKWYPSPGELLKKILDKDKYLKSLFPDENQKLLASSSFFEKAKDIVGEEIAKAWFVDTYLEENTLYVRTKFKKDWIDERFKNNFRGIFEKVEVRA